MNPIQRLWKADDLYVADWNKVHQNRTRGNKWKGMAFPFHIYIYIKLVTWFHFLPHFKMACAQLLPSEANDVILSCNRALEPRYPVPAHATAQSIKSCPFLNAHSLKTRPIQHYSPLSIVPNLWSCLGRIRLWTGYWSLPSPMLSPHLGLTTIISHSFIYQHKSLIVVWHFCFPLIKRHSFAFGTLLYFQSTDRLAWT